MDFFNWGSQPSQPPTPAPPVAEPSFYTGIYNRAVNATSGISATVSEKVGEFANQGKEFVGQVKDTVTGALSELVKEGTVLGDSYLATANFVRTNAMPLSYAGAAIGGLAITDSVISLIQKKKTEDYLPHIKKETIPMKEALKILSGSALIGLGVAFGANDNFERSKIINVALSFGLMNAAWKASNVGKPIAFLFQLKTGESNTQMKQVAVFPD